MLDPARNRVVAFVVVGLLIAAGGCEGNGQKQAEVERPLEDARMAYADERTADANALLERGDRVAAAESAREALRVEPQHAGAQAALRAAEAPPGPIGEVPLLDRHLRDLRVRRSEALAEFYSLMNRARSLATQHRYEQALNAVQQAQAVLHRKRASLITLDYETAQRETHRWQATTEVRRDLDRCESQVRLKAEAEYEAGERKRLSDLQARANANLVLRRVRDMRIEQRYDRAIELIATARFIDPHNPALDNAIQGVIEARIATRAKQAVRQRALSAAGQSADNVEASAVPSTLVAYPRDWPAITGNRLP